MPPGLNLFIPIFKVDEENRLIYGRITEETPDSVGEVMDYESSKPYFQKWNDFCQKATNGKSFGNVRIHHDKMRNAGHLSDIVYDDTGCAIDVVAKINDDKEWERVLDGDYTGFSPGGRYVRRWTDTDGKKRYTAEPNEVSLVDLPMHKAATFQLVKADGTSENRPFMNKTIKEEREMKVNLDEITLEKLAATYPLSTPLDILRKYAGEEISDAGSAIFALQSIVYLYQKEASETHPEAAAQTEALKTVIEKLKAFIAAEIMEADPGDVINLTEQTGDLAKVGASISASNKEKIQAIHDHASSLGADCSGAAKAYGDGDLQKIESERAGDLQKVETARDEALQKLETLTTERDDALQKIGALTTRVTDLEAVPAEAKGVTKTAAVTITKIDDARGAEESPAKAETIKKIADALDKGDGNAAAIEFIKAIHSKGGHGSV